MRKHIKKFTDGAFCVNRQTAEVLTEIFISH